MPEIQTYSGSLVDICDPKPESISIEDIARGLSMQCRFNGQVSQFYSVAQHSIMVARLVEKQLDRQKLYPGRSIRRAALLHDAAEAYLGDIITPVKKGLTHDFHKRITPFSDMEYRMLNAIHVALGVGVNPDNHFARGPIMKADLMALAIEVRALKKWPDSSGIWDFLPEPPDDAPILIPLEPAAAERAFLSCWRRLKA